MDRREYNVVLTWCIILTSQIIIIIIKKSQNNNMRSSLFFSLSRSGLHRSVTGNNNRPSSNHSKGVSGTRYLRSSTSFGLVSNWPNVGLSNLKSLSNKYHWLLTKRPLLRKRLWPAVMNSRTRHYTAGPHPLKIRHFGHCTNNTCRRSDGRLTNCDNSCPVSRRTTSTADGPHRSRRRRRRREQIEKKNIQKRTRRVFLFICIS